MGGILRGRDSGEDWLRSRVGGDRTGFDGSSFSQLISGKKGAESNVVGFELVELNPLIDPTYVSAMNANRIVREALTGMAMRGR